MIPTNIILKMTPVSRDTLVRTLLVSDKDGISPSQCSDPLAHSRKRTFLEPEKGAANYMRSLILLVILFSLPFPLFLL